MLALVIVTRIYFGGVALSITEKAKELAQAIKESEEFKGVKTAESRLRLDPNAQDLLKDLQQYQQKIMLSQHTGQPLAEEEIKALEQLQAQMRLNTTLQAMQKAQQSLEKIMHEVNETIAKEMSF